MTLSSKIKKIIALANIIVIDGLRRHALLGLLALALAIESGGLLFFDFIPRDIGRASADFIFSISWIMGFIFLFFHAVQIIAWDEERRTIHTLLAQPLTRGEYVLGVYVGLGTLLFMLNLLLAVIGWGTMMLIQQIAGDTYFAYFSHSFYISSWLGLFVTELMMLAAIMLFSGLIRGGFPVLLTSLCFYLICSGLPVVREAQAQRAATAGLTITDRLLQFLTVLFPDFSQLDFKSAVASTAHHPEFMHMLFGFGLFLTYTALLLWFACAVYGRRNLE